MTHFNFITDEDFRNSLEVDYMEMNKCLEAQAWKAVHVLSGSLLEAILSDYLLSEGIVKKKDVLSLDLGKAISLCVSNKIISTITADLSSVVKGYRNLIHPGRGIRLGEEVSSDSAHVAQSVVKIIVKEVAKSKRENYGYTAEQIVEKIERDSTAKAIIPYLLNDTKNIEKERLLLKILPHRYLTAQDDDYTPEHILPAFVSCFHIAYTQADDKLKRKIAKWFVMLLKEESDRAVFSYGTAFMRVNILDYLPEDEAALVKEHFLSRLDSNTTPNLLVALEGIGAYLDKQNLNKFIDPLVRLVCSNSALSATAKQFIKGEYSKTPDELDNTIITRLDAWIDLYKKKNLNAQVTIIEDIKGAFQIDPF